MAQGSSSNPNNLPGIVTDQPEIYESEQANNDDTGFNDLDLLNDRRDEAITLIEVPTRQAFAYFAERENEIAQFYVQRHGEYKLSSREQAEETNIEKYHRLVSEVNQLLNEFRNERDGNSESKSMSIKTDALTGNLEMLSRQLKALEFAAEDGSLNPSQAGFLDIKSKLDQLQEKVSQVDHDGANPNYESEITGETSKLIRISALERRLNSMESLIGQDNERLQSLFKATKCDNLMDATDTLGSWLSLFQQDNLQRVNGEIDYLCKRLEKLVEQTTITPHEQSKQLDAQAKGKLEQLYSLVTTTDKHRAMVPTILHRLNAIEELQLKAAHVTATVDHLEQVQSQIVDSLQSNKGELTSLTEMFSKNIDLMKQFSKDIDARIASIKM